jgi:energy-coupling factor transporter ATP-binding protein EcfA2
VAVSVGALEVRNFRSCRDIAVVLSSYTPIVGRNNCGKSNVVAALSWLIRKSTLSEDYFNQVDRHLEVAGTLIGIQQADIDTLPDPKHRAAIAKYVQDGTLHIKRAQAAPKVAPKLAVKDPGTGEWADNPTGIDAALNALFPEPIHIAAMEDAAEDAAKSKTTTTIGKLLAALLEGIRQRHEADLQVHLDALITRISAKGAQRFAELDQIDASINAKVRDLFPGVSVRLDFPVPLIEELIKAGTVRVFEDEDPNGPGRAFDSFGHGSQRAIQMALVRHLAEVRRGQPVDGGVNLLLIDEPELYLHLFAVEHIREALKTLAASGYQVVFTTHSAQMITPADASSALLMTKTSANGTQARPRLADALETAVPNAEHQIGLLFTLTHASQVFFADRVVLTEGKTELRLLPHLFQIAKGKTLGQAGIALVAQTGVNDTPKCMAVLGAMGIPAKAVVDLDFAFRNATTHGYLADNDVDIVSCKEVMQRIHIESGFCLSKDGLPEKGGKLKASQAFEVLAAHPDARPSIANLAEKLLRKNIWLWTAGAIEVPLGLKAKKETEWRRFHRETLDKGLDATASDAQSVRDLLEWLAT